MKKKSIELKQLRASKIEAQGAVIAKARTENRDLSDDETKEFDSLDQEIADLDSKIETAEKLEKAEERAAALSAKPVITSASNSEEREVNKIVSRFSITKALRAVMNGEAIDGVEKEINEIGQAENRASGVTPDMKTKFSIPLAALRATQQTVTQDSGNFGGALVQNQAPTVVDALRPNLWIEQLGATVMTGLTGGNMPLVRSQDFTMEFLAEGASITPHKKQYGGPVLAPKRAGGAVDITQQLILQSSPDVERMVMDGLRNGFATLLHGAALNGNGGAAPTGILNYTGVNASADAAAALASWAKIQELQGLIEEDDSTMQRLGFIVHPKLKSILKQIKVDAGSGIFLATNDSIDGIPYVSTSLIPTLAVGDPEVNVYPMIFGDFSQLFIGQWGALNIAVDPYSANLANSIRLVLNTHADCQIAHPQCFAHNKFLRAATA
jgi:HK97 family phage major capsid protein